MKKLLVATIVVSAIVGWDAFRACSQAQAASLTDAKVIGQWCLVKETKSTSYYASRGSREDCDKDVLVIKTNRLEGIEHVCEYTSVKTDASVSQINSKCYGEGYKWTTRIAIHLEKGRLVVKSLYRSSDQIDR
ncbi:MAG TPA: hypothetical protein VKK81_27965 [Candidatus Binatia bacterium]|nr:hypothetical protein [Candidatus Binatia bacterium]